MPTLCGRDAMIYEMGLQDCRGLGALMRRTRDSITEDGGESCWRKELES